MYPNLQERLRLHLVELARERDPEFNPVGHLYVQQYIQQQLGQWGTVEMHEFSIAGRPSYNISLTLPGSRADADPILVGAHYDAVPGSPGADDNATGVAVLLEMARAFAEQPAHCPIQLVAFDLEEHGFLGSKAYVKTHFSHREPLRLMLSLEMLGYCDRTPGSQQYPDGLEQVYPPQGDFIALVGNIPVIPDMMQLQKAIARYGQVGCQCLPAGQRGDMVPTTRRSDHVPFWDNGYRAIMVTDTADFRNPHYHQRSDRLDTLDFEFLTGVCQGLIAGLQQL
jgi:Zn-dependent M28 family amino/carboxypeptidase